VRGEREKLSWSLLIDEARPGWENMAIDSALLDLAAEQGEAFLRLYRWDPCCLSFGRHEPATRRYDREAIATRKLDCVRRPTGGRAVWHARELTYAVAAPLASLGGLREAYQRIHELLAAALRSLGAAPVLAATESRSLSPGSGPCFSAPVGGEVLLDERKVVGSAQLRQGDAFLQHGSLLLEGDQAMVRDLAGRSADPGGDTSLSAALARPVGFEEAALAVSSAAPALLGPLVRLTTLPTAIAAAAARHADHFRNPAWTWQR
jgi:lipoyl(octanoyl) transferase